MRRLAALLLGAAAVVVAVLFLAGSSASALTSYVVTTDADSGPGSLRAALDLADDDADDSVITFADGVDVIELGDGLEFEEAGYSLTILGGGVTITDVDDSSCCVALLWINDASAVTLRNITFDDGPNDGLYISDPTSDFTLLLDGFTASNNESNGLALNQDDDDYALDVTIKNSSFTGNGDDGASLVQYYDEPMSVYVVNSTFSGNGDDGLDAAHEGVADFFDDFTVTLRNSVFTGNGSEGAYLYRDEDYLIDAIVDGSHFDGNGLVDSDAAGLWAYAEYGGVDMAVTGSTFDDNPWGLYIEAGDDEETSEDTVVSISGSQANGNVEDGFTVEYYGEDDETVSVTVTNSEAKGNGDDGLDFYAEYYVDDMTLDVAGFDASGNGDSGIEMDNDTEDGESYVTITGSQLVGNEWGAWINQDYAMLEVTVTGSNFASNGDDGLEVENDEGEILLTVVASRFVNNGDDGLYVDNEDEPTTATLTASQFSGNGDDGADFFSDYDGGSFDVTARLSKFEDNGEDGLDVEAEDCDDVEMRVLFSQANGNTESGFQLDACEFEEATGFFLVATATGNGGPGVEISGGSGLVWLLFSDLLGNSGGKFTADPGVTVLPIGS
ncbi:MAG: right-handed parallel beta-helix repeat-containing protein [Acidimicrobiales bacterium]